MRAAPYKHFLAAELKHDGLPVLGNLLLGSPRVLSAMGSRHDGSGDDDDRAGTRPASRTSGASAQDDATGAHHISSNKNLNSRQTKEPVSIRTLLASIVSAISLSILFAIAFILNSHPFFISAAHCHWCGVRSSAFAPTSQYDHCAYR